MTVFTGFLKKRNSGTRAPGAEILFQRSPQVWCLARIYRNPLCISVSVLRHSGPQWRGWVAPSRLSLPPSLPAFVPTYGYLSRVQRRRKEEETPSFLLTTEKMNDGCWRIGERMHFLVRRVANSIPSQWGRVRETKIAPKSLHEHPHFTKLF